MYRCEPPNGGLIFSIDVPNVCLEGGIDVELIDANGRVLAIVPAPAQKREERKAREAEQRERDLKQFRELKDCRLFPHGSDSNCGPVAPDPMYDSDHLHA